MSILTDDCDIRQTHLMTYTGGDGDYYIAMIEFDKDGLFKHRTDYRCAMSGGNAPSEIKMAVVALYRAMEAAGLNKHPKDN